MANKKNNAAAVLNSLLQAELSAAATYTHVLKITKTAQEKEEVARIREEHQEAVRLLTAQILELGAEPSREPTTWKTIEFLAAHVSAEPLKDPVALKALKEGEEQDILSYENALNASLDVALRHLISEMLLPRTRAHLPTLERLLAAA